MDFFQPWHLIIIAVLALVLFGAKRLPELGKGLGEGWKGFKEGLSGQPDPNAKTDAAAKPTEELKPPPPAA